MLKHLTITGTLAAGCLILVGSRATINPTASSHSPLTAHSSKPAARTPSTSVPPKSIQTADVARLAKPASGQVAINEAVAIVRKTTAVRVWASSVSAMPPLTKPGYLSASTTVSRNRYAVTLTDTAKAYPVNDQKIQTTTGLGELVGIFSGQRYRSIAAARTALFEGNYMKPPTTRLQRVTVAPKILADQWTQGRKSIPFGVIEWHQNGWTIQVNQTVDIKLARNLAGRLRHTVLPASHGVIAVANAGDGAHTTVSWRVGQVVYQTFTENLPGSALNMAQSMRPVTGDSSPQPQS